MSLNQISNPKNKKLIITILTVFAILVFLVFLIAIVLYNVNYSSLESIIYNGQTLELDVILISLIVAFELGTMFYIGAILYDKYYLENGYCILVALLNYLFVIIESIGILAFFILGNINYLNIIIVFGIFLFHIFNYPKNLFLSIQQIIFPILSTVISVLFFHKATSNIVLDSLFVMGFIITISIVFGALLSLIKQYYRFRNNSNLAYANKYILFYRKYFIIAIIVYLIFVFIPGIIDFYNTFILIFPFVLSFEYILNILVLLLVISRQLWLFGSNIKWFDS